MCRIFLLFFALVHFAAHANPPKIPRPELALQIGHSSRVSSVALSQDGTMVASGSFDKTVKIWDARHGDVLHTLEEPLSTSIWNVKFSPNGSLLAVMTRRSAAGKTVAEVKLYSTRTGALLRSLPESTNSVFAMEFSPSGHWIATGGDNSGIHLWNVRSGVLEKSLKGHKGWSEALVFVNQEKNLISVSTQDQTLREWNTASGKLLRTTTLELPKDILEMQKGVPVALSSDGKFLAFGRPVIPWDGDGLVRGNITVCNAQTGAMIRLLPSSKGSSNSLVFLPDGKTLVVPRAGVLELWNLHTGTMLKTPIGQRYNEPTCAAFLPHTQSLIVGTYAGDVLLYDAVQPDQPQLRRTLRGRSDLKQNISFSADGRMLTCVSFSLFSRFQIGGTNRIWDTQTGMLQSTLRDSDARMRRPAFSPDGALCVAPMSDDNSNFNTEAKIEDAKTGAALRLLKDSEQTEHVAFINNGKAIVGSSRWKSLRIWDVVTGEITATSNVHQMDITDICVSPDGVLLVSADYSGVIRIWNARSEQLNLLRTITTNSMSLSVAFAPNSSTLAVTTIGKVLLYDVKSGALVRSLDAHRGIVMGAAFSPNGQRLATCGDGIVKIWDTKQGRLLATLISFPPDTETGVEDYLILTPEGYYSGSAAADRYVRFRLGDTLFPGESFQARYYRPDLVQKALRGEDLPPVGDFKGPLPPIAKLGLNSSGRRTGDTVIVNLAATDDSAIKSVAYFVNGARVDAKALTVQRRPLTADSRALTADARALTAESRPLTKAHPRTAARPLTAESRTIPGAHKTLVRYTVSLPLPPGEANIRLQAIAFDNDGLQSERDEILFTREAKTVTGELLGLCVGVSHYQDARLDLKFADADAKALSQVLGAQRGIYSKAKVSALTNEKATAKNTKVALDALIARSTRADTVILSLSGHGWRDDERNFYFAPYEVNRNSIKKTALPWKEITDRLTKLSQKSKRVIVLLDACHSGSAATNEELVKATLSANAGVLIFASSRGREVSLENGDWAHGAFTKALIEAIEGKAAPQGEKSVTMLDLLGYVSRRVKTLTENQQHPQVPFLQDFDTDAALMVRP